jgi:parvulin-like peptidyl-prolyl isomerase
MSLLVTRIRQQHLRGITGRTERTGIGFGIARVALLGAALLAAGCSDQAPPDRVTANEVKQQTDEALDAAAQLAQQERNDFQQAAQQELDEIKSELHALKREADSAQGTAREKLQRQVQLLEEKWNAAEAKLAALRAEGAQTWDAMKEQVLVALADLKKSYQEVRREITEG